LYGELTIKKIKKQIKLDIEFGGVVKDPLGEITNSFQYHRENKTQRLGIELEHGFGKR
jgi:polyisoprenoid-binding protein YceI